MLLARSTHTGAAGLSEHGGAPTAEGPRVPLEAFHPQPPSDACAEQVGARCSRVELERSPMAERGEWCRSGDE
jgi:hypothetical protein